MSTAGVIILERRHGHRVGRAARIALTETRLLVFAKAPQPGRVKTRLVPPLTPVQAAEVCDACLRDVITGARATSARLIVVYDDVPGAAEYFATAFPELERRPQVRGALGQRLENAFATCFAEGSGSVVIIGADSPTLPAAELSRGLAAARESGGAVGPTEDGGYYLIGLRRDMWPAAIGLFRDIPWSTGEVLEATRERAAEIEMELKSLSRWYDVDRMEDLAVAWEHARPESHIARLGWIGTLPADLLGRGPSSRQRADAQCTE